MPIVDPSFAALSTARHETAVIERALSVPSAIFSHAPGRVRELSVSGDHLLERVDSVDLLCHLASENGGPWLVDVVTTIAGLVTGGRGLPATALPDSTPVPVDSVTAVPDCYPCSRTDLLPTYLDRTSSRTTRGSRIDDIVLRQRPRGSRIDDIVLRQRSEAPGLTTSFFDNDPRLPD